MLPHLGLGHDHHEPELRDWRFATASTTIHDQRFTSPHQPFLLCAWITASRMQTKQLRLFRPPIPYEVATKLCTRRSISRPFSNATPCNGRSPQCVDTYINCASTRDVNSEAEVRPAELERCEVEISSWLHSMYRRYARSR